MSTSKAQPNTSQARGRTLVGSVVRRSGDKTVAVSISRSVAHPKYLKRSTVTQTYLVHDPENKAEVGQKVTIREIRPLSARKRWIIQHA